MIAFIPARKNSKSIPNKNLKVLGGKPLVVWSIESALKAGLRAIVSTDSEEIAKVARGAGAEVLMRPEALAQDDTSMFEVLTGEIPRIEPWPEVVLLLQPTSPFREKVHIRAAIDYLVNSPEYDSVIAVERVPEKWNPAQVIVNTPLGPRMANGSPISNRKTRRQEFPEAWVPTGSIYVFRTTNLERGNLYGEKTLLMEIEPTVNLNNLEDWAEAEQKINGQR